MQQIDIMDRLPSPRRMGALFLLALGWLLLVGLILPHGGTSDRISETLRATTGIIPLLLGLWSVILLESLLGIIRFRDTNRRRQWLKLGLIALVPGARLALATGAPGRLIWLPRLGWQTRDLELFERLEWTLAMPMLLVTLLILPVMGLELFFQQLLETLPALTLLVHGVTALIWFSFTTEFIVMVSLAERKVDYCKRNWINIIIIVLPLVAFLRTLRLFRVLRLTKAGKLLRAYRLRGLLTRAQRIALLFNLIERVLHRDPEKYLAKLREQEQDKLRELENIRAKIESTEALLADRAAGKPRRRSTGVE